jgi:hypothetical protein
MGYRKPSTKTKAERGSAEQFSRIVGPLKRKENKEEKRITFSFIASNRTVGGVKSVKLTVRVDPPKIGASWNSIDTKEEKRLATMLTDEVLERNSWAVIDNPQGKLSDVLYAMLKPQHIVELTKMRLGVPRS